MRAFAARSWPYVLYCVCAAILVLTRQPDTDEPWDAGPAVTWLREGRPYDMAQCMWGPGFAPQLLFPGYAALQTGWYAVFGVSILSGRTLSWLAGLLFLGLVGMLLSRLGIPSRRRSLILALIGTAQVTLAASDFIRPEIIEMALTAGALVLLLQWIDRPTARGPLFLAMSLIVVSMTMHLQAVFSGAAITALTAWIARKDARATIAWMAPCGLLAAAVLVWWNSAFVQASLEGYRWQLGGDMHGHVGGMAFAIARYWRGHEWIKLVVAIGLYGIPAVGLALGAYRERTWGRRMLLAGAGAAYISCVTNLNTLDDADVVWMIPAYIASYLATEPGSVNGSLMHRPLRVALVLVTLAMSAWGISSTIRIGMANPWKNLYTRDLSTFSKDFNLTESTVSGAREMMWFFDWNPSVLCAPAHGLAPMFLISKKQETNTVPDTQMKFGHRYYLVGQGEWFYLSRRNGTPADAIRTTP